MWLRSQDKGLTRLEGSQKGRPPQVHGKTRFQCAEAWPPALGPTAWGVKDVLFPGPCGGLPYTATPAPHLSPQDQLGGLRSHCAEFFWKGCWMPNTRKNNCVYFQLPLTCSFGYHPRMTPEVFASSNGNREGEYLARTFLLES